MGTRERRNVLLPDLLSYRTFIRNLVVKDLKIRYQASVLGFLWSMVNPLVTLAIYNLIFAVIMRVRIRTSSSSARHAVDLLRRVADRYRVDPQQRRPDPESISRDAARRRALPLLNWSWRSWLSPASSY
jgi:hypothetical protein